MMAAPRLVLQPLQLPCIMLFGAVFLALWYGGRWPSVGTTGLIRCIGIGSGTAW